MIIPSSLRIGGHRYTVIRREMDGKCGETDYAKRTITIDSQLNGTGAAATLLHEIFHACNSTLGDSELGHALIDSLSEQLFQVLSENSLLREDDGKDASL